MIEFEQFVQLGEQILLPGVAARGDQDEPRAHEREIEPRMDLEQSASVIPIAGAPGRGRKDLHCQKVLRACDRNRADALDLDR